MKKMKLCAFIKKQLKSIFKKDKPEVKDFYEPIECEVVQLSSKKLLKLINEYRKELELTPVKLDELACDIALDNVLRMIKDGKASHKDFPKRIREIDDIAEIDGIGECVAFGHGTIDGMFRHYLKSDDHREIIEGDYNYVGIHTEQRYNALLFVKYVK